MTKKHLIELLKNIKPETQISFSIRDDSKPHPFLRAFAHEVIEVVRSSIGLTVTMAGEFNNDLDELAEAQTNFACQRNDLKLGRCEAQCSCCVEMERFFSENVY